MLVYPLPSSTNLYKFESDGSVIYSHIYTELSFLKSWGVLTPKFLVKPWTANFPFMMLIPMNFSSSLMKTTQLPSCLVWEKQYWMECFFWTIPINKPLPVLPQTSSAAFSLSTNNTNNTKQVCVLSFWWINNHSTHLGTWLHNIWPITKQWNLLL